MLQEDGDNVTKITVAWISGLLAAFVTLLTTAITIWINRRSQAQAQQHQQELQEKQAQLAKELEDSKGKFAKELEGTRAQLGRDLEEFKSGLAQTRSEQDARQDYEYEARKRLYQQFEPLMFDLYMNSIGAMKRIHSLARTARQGNLGPESTWLATDRYYTLSTVYKLFAPLVIVKIMQRRLTLIDLSLDSRIRNQFALADSLYLSFTADFKLAASEPEIPYDPNREFSIAAASFAQKLQENPAKYARQGLNVGHLDSAVESMIMSDGSNTVRCMSYGEFEVEYEKRDSRLYRRFTEVMKLFVNFHPQARPVLWRILITQLFLYETIVLNSETNFSSDSTDWPTGLIDDEEQKRYFWRKGNEVDPEEFFQPFKVAEQFLKKKESKRSKRSLDQS